MTAPDREPELDVKVMRFYSRHRRQQLWKERARLILGWGGGLLLTTAILFAGFLAYQYWSTNEERLTALESRAVIAPAASATTMPNKPAQSKDLWAAGTWEMQAAEYLTRHAYDGVSSATPPMHRSKIQAHRRRVTSRNPATMDTDPPQ